MNIAGFDATAQSTCCTWADASFSLVGSLGGLAIDATVNGDATRTFSAEIGTAVAGASVGVSMSGMDLAGTSVGSTAVSLARSWHVCYGSGPGHQHGL